MYLYSKSTFDDDDATTTEATAAGVSTTVPELFTEADAITGATEGVSEPEPDTEAEATTQATEGVRSFARVANNAIAFS